MYRAIFITLLLNFSWNYFAFSQKSDTINSISFESLIDSCKMQFTLPKGYIELTPHENNAFNYQKRYKHLEEHFEVRYAVRNHPFTFYRNIFEEVGTAISDSTMKNYKVFDKEVSKRDFGADASASVILKAGKEFSNGYEYCLFIYIYKEGIGDAFIFFMAENGDQISKYGLPLTTSLKYKTTN